MNKASQSEVFNCTPTEFYKIISDYENYPEFISEVEDIRIIKTDGNKKLVEYEVSMIKTFTYRLWMIEEPNKITWDLDSGDLFKASKGSWVLEDGGSGKTKATYSVEMDFKIFVPGPMAKTLLATSLPNMMKSYHSRVKKLYGK